MTVYVLVLVVYLGSLAAIGMAMSRKSKSAGDFAIGGRSVGPWVTALSFVAAATGAEVHRRVVAAFGSDTPLRLTRGAVEHAAGSTVAALLRAWWPFTLLAAALSRRFRRRAVIGVVAVAAGEYARSGRRVAPVRGIAVRLADHLAYGVGVWKGVVRHRSARALVPVIGNRGAASTTTTVPEP